MGDNSDLGLSEAEVLLAYLNKMRNAVARTPGSGCSSCQRSACLHQ
ncbi:MAG: hypothetical protein ACRDOL_42190 [Streptosporangiaceae bacterium]